MNAFAKFSIALLLLAAAAIGAYLYFAPDDEGFDAAQSQPQDPICKQDEERLARLRAHPSLDEGLSFVSEIKCMQLWPQLQTVMDGLSDPSRSTASTSPNGPASDTQSASTAKPATTAPASVATSTALDDACKYDEDRLAGLQANPSVNAAIRFDSELRCPRLQPQLPAMLAKLSHNGGSVEAANPTARSDTTSAGQTAPPASESPAGGAASALPSDAASTGTAVPPATEAQATDTASKTPPNAVPLGATAPPASAPLAPTPEARATETTSADPDDPCKQDEERLAALQAKPSLDDAVRFQGELKCSRLQPQLLAVLDSLIQATTTEATSAAGTPAPSAAPLDAASIGAAPPLPSATLAPALYSPSLGAAPNASDGACKQDAERLGRLRETPSTDEAARFAQELRCEILRPQLLALTDGLAKPSPPDSGTASKDAKSAAANDTSPAVDTIAASQAAVDADRRIAALESDKEALGEKVSQLEHDREAASAEQASPPASPQPALPVEPSKTDPTSQAAVGAERRIAQLESRQAALTAKVSQLERDRETAPARQADPPAPPQPAPVAEQSQSEPASHAAVEAERRIAELEREKGALTAEVGRLQRHDVPSPAPYNSTPSPDPTAATERSDSEPVAAEASLPEEMPARVLIRYLANNLDARAQAEKLTKALRGQGIEVADFRESVGAIRTELIFSYAPDEAIALEVGRLAGIAPVRRIQPKDGLMVRPGTVDLNLSGDSHTAPIKTTLRRETNHE
jgi:phage shock protein A